MKKIKGFTLIELMIVVAIIGILASVMIPAITEAINSKPEAVVIENTEVHTSDIVDSSTE